MNPREQVIMFFFVCLGLMAGGAAAAILGYWPVFVLLGLGVGVALGAYGIKNDRAGW